jgi:hypothetical protein
MIRTAMAGAVELDTGKEATVCGAYVRMSGCVSI